MSHEVREFRFRSQDDVEIPDGSLVPVALSAVGSGANEVIEEAGHVCFRTIGWYEVLLAVSWDASITAGTRFAHSKIPGQQPLHSEAIDGSVLSRISGGRQLLRGNTVFGHDHTSELILEVWHDAGEPVRVRSAELIVRALDVPWSPAD